MKNGNGTLPESPKMYDEQIGQILSTKMSNQSIRLSFESDFIILCPNFDEYDSIHKSLAGQILSYAKSNKKYFLT